MPTNRRLAAIMFTDIVGYTAMMQKDEQRGLAMRQRHREVFEQFHEQYRGNILQYYGDGTLSIFDSAVDAAACAVAIQQALQQEPQVPLRIGIHTGDILYSEEEVVGDGVNIASRIESMAAPGSIMISDIVYDYLKNQPEFPVRSMGKFSFKNVNRPLEVYAIEKEGIVLPDTKELTGKFTAWTPPDKRGFINRLPIWARFIGGFVLFLILAPFIYFPLMQSSFLNAKGGKTITVTDEMGNVLTREVIAGGDQKKFLVTSFTNTSEDTTYDWLGVGIPYALEMDWDQDPYIFNVYEEFRSSNSLNEQLDQAKRRKCKHLLKGTVSPADSGYQVNIKIYDASSGQLSHDNDYQGKDLFSLLDEISLDTKTILGVPESHLRKVKDLPISQVLTTSEDAFRLFSEAVRDRTLGNYFPFEKLEKAIELDSTFAWANYFTSDIHYSFQRSKEMAKAHIAQAMRHRKRLPDVFEAAIRQLNYRVQGQPTKALQLTEMLSRLHPDNFNYLAALIREYFIQDQYEKALEANEQYKELQNEPFPFMALEASCLLRLGRVKEGIQRLNQYKKLHPEDNDYPAMMGRFYLADQNWEQARAMFEQASLLAPESKIYPRLIKHVEFMQDSASVITPEFNNQIAGEYWVEHYAAFKLSISSIQNQLFVSTESQGKYPMYPVSTYKFVSVYDDTKEFEVDEAGNIIRMKTSQGGRPPYSALKISPEIQEGMEFFEQKEYEKALPIFTQAYETYPEFTFLDHLIRHITFSNQPGFSQQEAQYENLTGRYKKAPYDFRIYLRNGQLFMKSDQTGWGVDPIALYEMEPGVFMNLVLLESVVTFKKNRNKMTITMEKLRGQQENQTILERVSAD